MDDGSEYIDVGVGIIQVTYLMICYGYGLGAGNRGAAVTYLVWNPPEAVPTINGRAIL